ncbi:hypothetical protein [Sphingomonas sp.]|jgi:hypothetical protein|uniref:hypothetical protein n=1 Tax=Sphingomonas sp. TaxID=28214 RepID=UPI002D80E254|nr:hypothetical protein [Sphingomonas sp.]HEU0044368.1 hypothetical protein [Sphingomonas sp.]
MLNARATPPVWFWVVAALLLLWGLAGIASFWMHLTYNPDDPANAAYDRQLYRSLPGWLNWVYAVAVGGGLLGAAALLMRHRAAVPLTIASLIAIVIQFGWTLGMTDLIAAKGFATAAGFPIFIFAMGLLGAWTARTARARGWIG